MTETTENTAGTEVVQVAPGALALVAGAKPWSITDLAEKIAPPEPVLPKDAEAPKPAKVVNLTPVLKKALGAIPNVFAKVQPTESRRLEAAELKKLTDEAIAISQAAKPLGDRAKAISEIIRHHMDHAGESDGLVNEDTLRIADGVAKGHFLFGRPEAPFEVGVEGYEDAWQQRYVKGSVSVNGGELLGLYEDGAITREEYLACTREVRSYDEAKISAFIRKNPQRGLEILTAITHRSAPGASVYPPKK